MVGLRKNHAGAAGRAAKQLSQMGLESCSVPDIELKLTEE